MAPSIDRQSSKQTPEVIDLTQESDTAISGILEDEDLRRAIALSLQDQAVSVSPSRNDGLANSSITTSSQHANPRPISPNTGGILGFDRKQMEQERIARLKRKRGQEEISPPPLSRRTKSPPAPPVASNRPASKPVQTAVGIMSSKTIVSRLVSTSPFPTKPGLQYAHGTIKQTWCEGQSRTPSDITFSELVDAPNLDSTLLSSYIWDFDWLLPHFNTKSTKFIFVMHAKDPLHRQQLREDFDSIPNVHLCFPPMDGIINCMHSKLMLLFYADRLRLVVPTANLMAFDWGEGGVMENSLFIIDLPKLVSLKEPSQNENHNFYTSLLAFLFAQNIPTSVLRKLALFDFSATTTANIGFVHTIGGMHTGSSWRSTGHCGLGATVSQLGLAKKRPVELDFVTSSVGSLNDEFMRSIYLAALGDNGLSELALRNRFKATSTKSIKTFFQANASRSDDEGVPTKLIEKERAEEWRSHFRFFFPSHATVASSKGGTRSAGTICFQRRWWENADKFPRGSMRDCISTRKENGGVLMHNKIMFVRYTGEEKENGKTDRYGGWVYLGSANLSESAWGRLVMDRSKKKEEGEGAKLNCRNWECGVVVPVEKREFGKMDSLDMFNAVLPVPMEYPGKAYDGNREPWFFGQEGMAA